MEARLPRTCWAQMAETSESGGTRAAAGRPALECEVHDMLHSDTELGKLERQARDDLATLAYPGRDWVEPVTHSSGQHVYDVVVVGAGQSASPAGSPWRATGVSNVLLIDRNAEGSEGVWDTFARMETLRTPKMLVGVEGGFASLSARRWLRGRPTVGRPGPRLTAWRRQDWMRYLRWLRGMCNLAIENETALESIEPDGEVFALRLASAGGRRTVLARYVVLATGYDGGGEWRIPAHIETAVPPKRCFHSNGPVDFDRMRGKRVGILGHGASAFDNACAALAAGAGNGGLCVSDGRHCRPPTRTAGSNSAVFSNTSRISTTRRAGR